MSLEGWTPYSRRGRSQPTKLTYEVPTVVRKRLLHTMAQAINGDGTGFGALGDFHEAMADVTRFCVRLYGDTKRHKDDDPPRGPVDVAVQHFAACTAEELMDFFEALFRSRFYMGGQRLVDMVNAILREEGVGYEFSPFVHRETEITGGGSLSQLSNALGGHSVRIEVTYPEAVKLANQTMHAEVVAPALVLLAAPLWKTANEEMLDAHRAYREGRYEDANTACGRAFETVLKTICEQKKWHYDPQKSTAKDLLMTCKNNGLYPDFYANILDDIATTRNRMGGHGKGPNPMFTFSEPLTSHMIHQTSATILLVAKLAKLA